MFKLLSLAGLVAAEQIIPEEISAPSVEPIKDVQKASLFLQGFIEGAIGAQFDSIVSCETDALFELAQVKSIVSDLLKKQTEQAVIDDIKLMAIVVPQFAEKCATEFRDQDLLNGWKAWIINQMENPKVFFEHI